MSANRNRRRAPIYPVPRGKTHEVRFVDLPEGVYRDFTQSRQVAGYFYEPKPVVVHYPDKIITTWYINAHNSKDCRNPIGPKERLNPGGSAPTGEHKYEDVKPRSKVGQIERWAREYSAEYYEHSDHSPEAKAARERAAAQAQQQEQQVQNTRETRRSQQPPTHAPTNNNRLNQQVENLRAELEAKNERISELEERNKELEDQLQYQKADAERCRRRLRLAEARQAGPRYKGRGKHEEHEEDEDDEEDHFIVSSGGDDDDSDDDTGGASAAVRVGGASAQKRRQRRGKRPQEEEKKDDEADSSEDGEDSEEEEEDNHQQQRARRGRHGRGGKKKKTGEDDDAGSGNQQDDQVPGGGGQFSFTREEFEAKLETMQARLLAQLRAELADASAADAAAAAAASVSSRVEEQDGDISTERPAAVAAVGGEPILGGNTLPQSIQTGATAAGTAATASGANADGRHKRRHETGFAHPSASDSAADSSDDDTDGLCRRQRRSKRSKVDMMEEFESKAELPQMMKGSATPSERGERQVEKSTEEEGMATEDADHWKEATDEASGRPYYYNTATNETTWDKPECLCAAEKKVPASAKATSTSKDLPRGVRFGSKSGEFVAKISRRGTERIIGTFDSAEKASIAYKTVNMYLVENGINSSDEFLSNLDAARQLARDAVETAGQYV